MSESTWLERLKGQNWKVILALAIVTGVACAPIYFHRITVPVDTDYGTHVLAAQQLLDGQSMDPTNLSHPMIQLILVAMHLGTGGKLGLYASLIIVQVVVQVVTALILFAWFGKGERKGWDWIRAGVAASLTFVAPAMLLAFGDGLFYYGYIGLANYHNPTIHLLEPVALLSVIYAIRAANSEQSSWKDIGLAAVWITLSTLIKPNYVLSILPTMTVVAVIRWLQRRRPDLRMLAFGFALPGVVMLVLQWYVAFQAGDPGAGIILAPFVVEGSYSDNLALKFLLSALFPLAVILIARRQLLEDASLLVGWVGLLAGAAQFYLLAESGNRMYHANFRWSAQIMLFLLFAIAARWLLREKILSGGFSLWQKIISYGAYLAQVAGGVAYYVYCMVSIHYR